MTSTIKWRIAQKLELKWWQNYLKNKDVGEYLNWKKKYWSRFLEEIDLNIQSEQPKDILDAGCGPAGIFTILEDHKVTALDPLLETYDSQISHFSKTDYPNTHFIDAPIEALNEEKRFDVIFCLNAINHVADIELAYDRLFSALKPEGLLVVSIDSHKYGFLKRLFRLIPGDALHPHQYDLKDYQNFLTKRGGTIIKEVNQKPGNMFDYYVQVVRKGE